MALPLGKILKPVFKVSASAFQDMVAQRYGHQDDMDDSWQHFEPVASTLVDCFYMAMDDSRFETLVPKLDAYSDELRGIAYEGAGMGLGLLDGLLPWKNRIQAFVAGPGKPYMGLVYIGAGLVLPRAPLRPDKVVAKHDPLLRWFVMDGYGFYEGFFSWRRAVEQKIVPNRVVGYGRRAYDHGLGRSLWFATGANVERIVATLNSFPASRRPDLWSGIGLACAYAAGVVDRPAIKTLLEAAGPYKPQMATGTALAAMFRQQAGDSAAHTDLACDTIFGLSSNAVAEITNQARKDLPYNGPEPAYEIWRQRIAAQYVELEARAYQDEVTVQ